MQNLKKIKWNINSCLWNIIQLYWDLMVGSDEVQLDKNTFTLGDCCDVHIENRVFIQFSDQVVYLIVIMSSSSATAFED